MTAGAGEPVAYKLARSASLEVADDLKSVLSQAAPDAWITIDASAVDVMSTPVALLLVSALNSRAQDAPKIAITAPTPAFMDAFSDLGLFSDLMRMEFPA